MEPPVAGAERLAEELKVHPVLAAILMRRGLTEASRVRDFLEPAADSLESPFAFRDMAKAVERIRRAAASKEKVLVYGDYDVDGVTASAILYPALTALGLETDAYLPHRILDGYGLNRSVLERLLKKKRYSLVITVDNGITSTEAVAFLASQGVDAILVDHHLPKDGLPGAFAIISGAAGGTGDASLAACGLAFKLAWALLGEFKRVEDSLDLVAVGTIADIADVTGDNRALLKLGLPTLRRTSRIGLLALVEEAGLTLAKLGPRDVAFGLGPRINASGRMGSPETAFKLLTTTNSIEARNLAKILEEGNRQRQREESDAFEEAVEILERDGLGEHERAIVLAREGWHEGVLGIVASRLTERYGRPAVVIALREDGSGKGSGRSVAGLSIFDPMRSCEELLTGFGGHAQAVGLSIKKQNVAALRGRLNETLSRTPRPQGRTLRIDAELKLSEINERFLNDLDRLSPFGPGHEEPRFLTRGLRLRGNPKRVGQDTLRAWVTDESGKFTSELVGFRAYGKWTSQKSRPSYDIVHRPALNHYRGLTSIGLKLEDWR